MRMKKLAVTVLSALLIAGTMTSCGSRKLSSEAVADTTYKEDGWGMAESAMATEEAYTEEPMELDAASMNGSTSAQADLLADGDQNSVEGEQKPEENSQRKLIKNMNFDLETTEFHSLISVVESKVGELNGYIESSTVSGNPDQGRRRASITARVPADQLDAFSEIIGENAVVISKSTSVQDVTLSYTDLAAHISALRAEQQTLTEMLTKAEDMESIIIIQNELTNIRYELESYESQLRVMDNQVSYSTVYMSVQEVKTPTAQVQDTFMDRLSRTFRNSLNGLGEGIVDFLIVFLGNLPGILVFVAVIFIIYRLIRLIVRRIRKKSEEKRKKMMERAAGQYGPQNPNMPQGRPVGPQSPNMPQGMPNMPQNLNAAGTQGKSEGPQKPDEPQTAETETTEKTVVPDGKENPETK